METVGIRELKAKLSHYLQRVSNGATLVVTDRGREVATIAPVKPQADTAWAWKMVEDGRAHWNGGKPKGCANPPSVPADRLVSTAVIEDRR